MEDTAIRLEERRRTIEQALKDQHRLLVAVAAGLDRSEELERDYQTRSLALRVALAYYQLPDPFPFPSLAAWIAECKLGRADLPACRARLEQLAAPVQASLAAI